MQSRLQFSIMSKNFTNELIKNEIKMSMDDEKRTLDTVFIEKFGCSLKQKKYI